MLKESYTRSIPIHKEVTTDALSELFGHSVDDMMFTVDEVQTLIDMLQNRRTKKQ